MVFGTFDGIHPGHRHFFKQAKSLAADTYLVVSIARDQNVERIKKRKPKNPEKARLDAIAQLPEVDQAVLGGLKDYIPHIQKANPDIIALGYDQSAYIEHLSEDLAAVGLSPQIIRLKPYKPHIYKSSLLNKI